MQSCGEGNGPFVNQQEKNGRKKKQYRREEKKKDPRTRKSNEIEFRPEEARMPTM